MAPVPRGSSALFWPPWTLHAHAGKTFRHKIKNIVKKIKRCATKMNGSRPGRMMEFGENFDEVLHLTWSAMAPHS